jgi:hypothetical protein
MAIGALSLSPPSAPSLSTRRDARLPSLVVWAWERPEDLRDLPPGIAVAFLAQTITIGDGRVTVAPRRHPMRVTPRTPLMAVTRIETVAGKAAGLSGDQLDAAAQAVARTSTLRGVTAVQTDFDATESERPLYRRLLAAIRRELGAQVPLSMTALASWCAGDRWLDDLPIDEAVPMLFELGPTNEPFAGMATSAAGADRRCRSAIGVSLGEPRFVRARGRRVYVFNPTRWTDAAIARAREVPQ